MSEQLTDKQIGKNCLVSGSAHLELAQSVAEHMGIALTGIELRTHPNGESYIRYEDNIRGKQLFLLQTHTRSDFGSPNDAIKEHELMIYAARSSSAKRINAVTPYLGYTRSDRKAKSREAIGVGSVIDGLWVNGANRIVTIDMHQGASQIGFRGPFDNLTGQIALRQAIREEIAQYPPEQCAVIAPDPGASKMADKHNSEFGFPNDVIHVPKMRNKRDSQIIYGRPKTIPQAKGMVCVMMDDILDTAGTAVSAANILHESGAEAIYLAATHGFLSDPATQRLLDSPFDRIWVTDTVPGNGERQELAHKLSVVSVAPLIATALTRIIKKQSLADLFREENYM